MIEVSKNAAMFVGGPWDGRRLNLPEVTSRYFVATRSIHGPTGSENVIEGAVRYDLHIITGLNIYLIESPPWEKASSYERLIRALAEGYKNV